MGWKVGSQPLVVDFQAGCLVEDAGLLAVRELDVSLGVNPKPFAFRRHDRPSV